MKAKLPNKINLKDYSDSAYIGIDVHRKTYSVAIIVNRLVVKKVKMSADPAKLIAYLRKTLPKAKLFSVYESGFSGYYLHRILTKAEVDNLIVNPASIQVASANRVKTDKLDAIKLAEHLSLGLLKGIRIRSIKEEEERLLSRNRQLLIRDRTRMINRVRKRFLQLNLLPINYDKVLSYKYASEVLSQECVSATIKESMSHLMRLWKEIETEIKSIKIKYKCIEENSPLVQKYLKIPGIGIITAITLAHELGDCSQFKSESELFSFIGLTPSEYSSGEKVRKGRITRQGNPQLRFMLIESSWVAIRVDPALKAFYNRVAAKRGGNKAIVGVARKLLGRARATIKNNQDYELDYNKINNQLLAA